MIIKFNWWLLLLGFGALQGYFFAGLLLIQRRGNRSANRWLALLVFLVAYFLTAEIVMLSGLHRYFPHIIGTGFTFWYILGGLVYIYTKFLQNENHRLSLWDSLHLLPLIYILQRNWHFYRLSGMEKIRLFEQPPTGPPAYHLSYFLLFLLMMAYFMFSIYKLNQAEHRLRKMRQQTRLAHIRWVKKLLIAFTIYLVFDTVAGYILLSSGDEAIELQFLTMGIMALFVMIVAYTAVRDPHKLFPETISLPVPTLEKQPIYDFISPKKKYQNSALSPADAQKHLARLLRLMDKEKPYLNNELNLSDLAEMLNLSSHNLSQILNQELGQSFYEFINVYRVKAAQAYMMDPAYKDYTILGIAMEAGFNSKTSFNRMFKKCTGQTPSSYLKQHIQ